MGRPRKVKPLEEKEESKVERSYPTPVLHSFGYPRPAPKPSQTKKRRGVKEESEE